MLLKSVNQSRNPYFENIYALTIITYAYQKKSCNFVFQQTFQSI